MELEDQLLILVALVGAPLAILWIQGVAELMRKNRNGLAWVAIVGSVVALGALAGFDGWRIEVVGYALGLGLGLGLVGYAGWFVEDRSGESASAAQPHLPDPA